jgi:hypothetical protein
MTKQELPNVASPRGAPMGRVGRLGALDRPEGKWTLQRVRIDAGGYDSGGAYWGTGTPLYWACSADGEAELFFRATSRDAAKAHVRRLYSLATFYR